jgi:hypothetical protein
MGWSLWGDGVCPLVCRYVGGLCERCGSSEKWGRECVHEDLKNEREIIIELESRSRDAKRRSGHFHIPDNVGR